MHTSLDLRTCSSQLKSYMAFLYPGLEVLYASDAHILEGMLQTRIQVRQEGFHGTLVLHITRHTLRDLYSRRFGEISRCSSVRMSGLLLLAVGVLVARFVIDTVDFRRRRYRFALFHGVLQRL